MIHVTKEKLRRGANQDLLLDYVRRLETCRSGRRAIHIPMSGLRPSHRRAHHIGAATAGFEALVKLSQGQLFVLENLDLIFIYEIEAQFRVEAEIKILQKLFEDNDLLSGDQASPLTVTWFDLEYAYEEFVALIIGGAETELLPSFAEQQFTSRGQTSLRSSQKNGVAASPETARRLAEALQKADLSNLLRRQAVYVLGHRTLPQTLFREIYFSIPDLGEAVLPGGNLMSNTNLFRLATKTLDKVMLSSMVGNKNLLPSCDLSINLNIESILSEDFAKFDASIGGSARRRTVIEVQCPDIVADAKNYLRVRELLREKGYRVCLDGVTHRTLKEIDRASPDVDFIKIHWDSQLVAMKSEMRAQLRATPQSDNGPRFVITRVGTPDALAFGQSLDIRLFQGRYVDTFVEKDARLRELVRSNRGFQTAR